MTPWVFADLSYLGHRARSTTKDLSFNDLPTGVTFGFFNELYEICSDPRIMSNKVAICADSFQSFRRRSFPDYKKKRYENRTPEEVAAIQVMHQQLERLKDEILPDIGFPVFEQNGLESDDMMAQGAAQASALGGGVEAVIVTADQDLCQCISFNVHWWDPTRSRNIYLDPGAFWAKFHVHPHEWAMVKSLCGCSGDGVPPIPGIGEKSAIDYVLDILPKHLKKFKDIESPEGRAIAARNYELVRLPHPKTKPLNLVDPVYRPDRFYHWAAELGFKSMISGDRKYDWDGFFDGSMRKGCRVAETTSRPRVR